MVGTSTQRCGRPPRWRLVAAAAATLMAVTLGLVVTTLPVQASHGGCVASNCAGKWPSSENCISGSTAVRSLDYHPCCNNTRKLQSIHAVYRSHCSYWARHTYDRDKDPARYGSRLKINFKIERWGYRHTTSGSYWDLTHTQSRTIENVDGTNTTRMVPLYLSDNQIRYRACARESWSYWGGPYEPYGSWRCTSFVTHG
jgi:hypothetical protein